MTPHPGGRPAPMLLLLSLVAGAALSCGASTAQEIEAAPPAPADAPADPAPAPAPAAAAAPTGDLPATRASDLGAPLAAAVPFSARVGPDATVKRLPRANGRVVEMYLRDPDINLQAILRGNTRDIASMDATNLGGGVWLVRMAARDESKDLIPTIEDGVLRVEVAPRGRTPGRLRAPAPTLGALLAGDLPAEPPPAPSAQTFQTLQGDALSDPLDPWAYTPVLTRTPDLVFPPSWERIDQARAAMLAAPAGSRKQIEQTYFLGYYYLMLGFPREARYYFNQISNEPGPIAQADLALERARAAQGSGRWEEARAAYADAARLGAHEDSVVEGLAVVSLATGTPPRAPMGRLLWNTTSHPAALMLAAELLQMDGRVAESRYLLEGITEGLPEELIPRWALRLGDARFADGSPQEAQLAWRYARPDLRDIRETFFALYQTGADPAAWAGFVPELVHASAPRTEAGAEALYLLSQIDRELMAREDAINDLATLMKRHPKKAVGSDVPERFWGVYAQHVKDLARAERWFDLAALHETVWDHTVRRAVQDPQPLVSIARAYEEVGLPDRAVQVLREAVAVLVSRGEDDPKLVRRLAELYLANGNFQDGLDAVRYLREMVGGKARVQDRSLDLLEGRLHLGLGNGALAAASLKRAASDPALRDEASMILAVIDAEGGQCRRAEPVLTRMLFVPQGEARWTDPRPWLALARCKNLSGDAAGAARAAKAAAELSGEGAESRYARWLSTMAGGWRDTAAVEALAAGDDIWATIAKEQQAAASFAAGVDLRRETDWQRTNRLLGP
ncbi:MAG: hypothetical protein RL071_1739 [Pseudomonadota bacterium]